jgi:hypothetical protein
MIQEHILHSLLINLGVPFVEVETVFAPGEQRTKSSVGYLQCTLMVFVQKKFLMLNCGVVAVAV